MLSYLIGYYSLGNHKQDEMSTQNPNVSRFERDCALHLHYPRPLRLGGSVVSKKTKKRKLRARRNKANHGKRPNVGRR